MRNGTGARGPLPSGRGSRYSAPRPAQPHGKTKPRRPFGFWDFLLPAILGGAIFVGLSLLLLTVGPRAMSLSTFFGGATVIVLLLTAALLFVVPISMLFIMPKTGFKMMLVFWPIDFFMIGLAIWVMTHVSIPI